MRGSLIEKVRVEIQDQETQLTIRVSKLEDADIAKDVTELTMRQTANEATLYSQGNIMRRTLFDFIG